MPWRLLHAPRVSVALGLALMVLDGCPSRHAPRAPEGGTMTRRAAPAVRCMVYRECGCVLGCAGISVPREELVPGLVAPIVAGEGCGRSARVESAPGPHGLPVLVLSSEERCGGPRCASGLMAVDPEACEGQCDRCAGARK